MSRVVLCSFVLVCLASVAVACGETGGNDLSFSEWQDRTNDVCSEYEPRVQAQSDEQPEVTSAEDLVALIDAVTPLNTEYREALVEVGVPDERAEEVEDLHEDLQAQEELALEIRQVAANEGLEAATRLLEQLGTSSEELNQRAQDLGVPACDSR